MTDDIRFTSRTETKKVTGIVLTVPEGVRECHAHRVGREVFVPRETLEQLADQDRWDSSFGEVLLLETNVGLALEGVGFAEQETRGGWHGTPELKQWLALQLIDGPGEAT